MFKRLLPKLDAILAMFVNIHWSKQLLIGVLTAVFSAVPIAIVIARIVYPPITGLSLPEFFNVFIAATAAPTAVLVAVPIVGMLLTFSYMLGVREQLARDAEDHARASEAMAKDAQLLATRKNHIFAALLESSISMQRSDKLVDLIDNVLLHLERLLPEFKFGIIVDTSRPSMIMSFSSRDISEEEKQILTDNNDKLLDENYCKQQKGSKKSFERFNDWLVFPMCGQGEKIIGKLMVKGKSLDKDNEEVIEIFLEQLTATAENKLLSFELEKLANIDQLTGLYSRNFFQIQLEKQLELKEKNSSIDFSIIHVDINGLKMVNDKVGHVAGDMLIKKSADLLKRSSRQEDWVCRVGGDEFIILCPCTRSEGVGVVIDRIEAAAKDKEVEVLDQYDNKVIIELHLSIGLASSSEVDPEKVYSLADERMYVEKRRFYRDLDEKAIANNDLV